MFRFGFCFQCRFNRHSAQCTKSQAEYSNSAQRDSISALIMYMKQVSPSMSPRAVIINGDLTEYGHDSELNAYVGYWRWPIQVIFNHKAHHFIMNFATNLLV